MSKTLIYLDLNMGSKEDFASQTAQYEQTTDYCTRTTPMLFGVATQPKNLDNEQKESLREYHSTNPELTEGLLFTAPETLRVGRVVVELNDTDCPKTCENMRKLCTGEKGAGKIADKLHFKDSPIHRVVQGKLLQGGDITRFDGSGGESIWAKKFNDEKKGLLRKLDKPGLLAMANSGKNSNTSQYFLTTTPLPKLSGKHVVFGEVTEGLDVLEKIISTTGSAESESPSQPVWVDDCGVL